MVSKQTVFKYKTLKGPLHKLPPMLKLFLLLPLSIFCLALPSFWLCIGIITAVITAFLCRFTLREQLTDLKPAALYAALMYAISVLSNLYNYFYGESVAVNYFFSSVILPTPSFLSIALRLTLIIQLSALLFRATSAIEIRECLHNIGRFLRRIFSKIPFFGKRISQRPRFAENISVFIMFIPEIFLIWSNIDLAWKARGGKQNFKKIKMLVFTLIALSFEKAALKARALEARMGN